MLIVGEREVEAGTVSVRRHREGDIGSMSPSEFAEHMERELYTHLIDASRNLMPLIAFA